jgi:hypothetical protein
MTKENVFRIAGIFSCPNNDIRPPPAIWILVVIDPHHRTVAHAAHGSAGWKTYVDTAVNNRLFKVSTTPQVGSILKVSAVTPGNLFRRVIPIYKLLHKQRL